MNAFRHTSGILLMAAASIGTTLAGSVEPVSGDQVLVVANRGWTGPDGAETGTSEAVARHYMLKRNVPEANLLLVEVPTEPDYATFHREVIVPVAQKLKTLREPAETDPILYILCCYGMPLHVNLPVPNEIYDYPDRWQPKTFTDAGAMQLVKKRRYATPRSADSFLCYPHLLAQLAADRVPDAARYDFGGVFQDSGAAPPKVHPYYGLCVQAADAARKGELRVGFQHAVQPGAPLRFAAARRQDPNRFAYYLVCRLDAPNPLVARSLVDKAVYAERYLALPGNTNSTSTVPEAVFDLGELARTNEQIEDAIRWFAGQAPGSPFRDTPWPMLVDRNVKPGEEIGIPDAAGNLYRPADPRFAQRDFPIRNVLWYYGNYTTWGRYQDVYQWAVGSVGVHADSGSCADMHPERFDAFQNDPNPPDSLRAGFVPHALMRNLTASSGAVHEPFEDGIIAANFLFRALSLGMPFADACYAATRDIWWKSVFIGDPLYRPFGGTKVDDVTPPRFLHATARLKEGTLTVSAETDKPCQFAVQAGARLLRPFHRWGEAWSDRDWLFACELDATVALQDTAATDLVVTARSPAGLESQQQVPIKR
jgi:hypothetical protein